MFERVLALSGGFRARRTHPATQILILGFFAQNVTFGRAAIFFGTPTSKSTCSIFFVFQNPAVGYFAHIASIAENIKTVLCAGDGRHAQIFLDPQVPWWLLGICVKSVQHTYNKYIYARQQAVAGALTVGTLNGQGGGGFNFFTV